MYEVVIVRADYEGWWLFEGWQNDIINRHQFNDDAALIEGYSSIIEQMKEKYNSYIQGKYDLYAFFNACEIEFCEDCDEDVQIYYTPIMTKNNEFYKND
ncbi:hypothetical protein GCM10007275_03380 [Jeotgalicoccus coquinae]|uniref:DUF1033 domain-containing protein n=1 Tax=Jeotgalicoccus coquinae TaxID=709509 RepID=A0A6V7R8C3_9STAP|nr:DUF1033 family protein [Jeotgalicoccus coquinae]MBB6422997.1 hypothetical protein [Jeotgalicoccus coquinae]GGE11512.1 hypothetical protein GCM10007275_03380 [Jeotgalicoccus coquinae]CAD2073536.1 hypothetical protein JEOCOQ751_00685 [Jeotgalicoccus coquinae]